jgi:hypothetical protein
LAKKEIKMSKLDNNILTSLEGDIQSQGIRISASAWLDFGSEDWKKTSDKAKAYAYQAAKITGWSETAIRNIASHFFPHHKPDFQDYIFSHLRFLESQYPAEIIETQTTEKGK